MSITKPIQLEMQSPHPDTNATNAADFIWILIYFSQTVFTDVTVITHLS